MNTLKVTTWNAEWVDDLIPVSSPSPRLDALVREVQLLDADALCLIEGPAGEPKIRALCERVGGYVPVLAGDGEYATSGRQWIWWLVKPWLADRASLLPVSAWSAFAGSRWEVRHWGDPKPTAHRHYRHPQVLVLQRGAARIELIGVHFKSKFVNAGERKWRAGGEARAAFVAEALKARVKLVSEAENVRAYLDAKFAQVARPSIFVLGDLNDGPGKEWFEREYLRSDLVSALQGDVFFAERFLNHALFDHPRELRWTARFDDFVDPGRDPRILLDHILFTQPVVDGAGPAHVAPGAGFVEHEVHALVNAGAPAARRTSDHAPVSVRVELAV